MDILDITISLHMDETYLNVQKPENYTHFCSRKSALFSTSQIVGSKCNVIKKLRCGFLFSKNWSETAFTRLKHRFVGRVVARWLGCILLRGRIVIWGGIFVWRLLLTSQRPRPDRNLYI
jgi:hypothetical protein